MRSVNIFESEVAVIQEGAGDIPLLVVGPASLFLKRHMLPKAMQDTYTIYYVDIFDESISLSMSLLDDLDLDSYVEVIESIRVQLSLPMVSLFAHSALGVLGYEYAKKYADKVSSLMLIATSPIWSGEKSKMSALFFEANSGEKRKDLFQLDSERYKKIAITNPRDGFIETYVSRRAHFFFDVNNPLASEQMWKDVRHNMHLVNKYFQLIQGYDIRYSRAPDVPLFLALGMYDSSVPFFAWTDDTEKVLRKTYYHIFDRSGHYPMLEQAKSFMEELQKFNQINFSNSARLGST